MDEAIITLHTQVCALRSLAMGGVCVVSYDRPFSVSHYKTTD